MSRDIIFWINPETGVIYNRVYSGSQFTRKVGDQNQFGHIILSIGVIRYGKYISVNNGHEIWNIPYEKPTKKQKIIQKIIEKLERIK